jgi:hypothetical protein
MFPLERVPIVDFETVADGMRSACLPKPPVTDVGSCLGSDP